jgi:hypothetical protein
MASRGSGCDAQLVDEPIRCRLAAGLRRGSPRIAPAIVNEALVRLEAEGVVISTERTSKRRGAPVAWTRLSWCRSDALRGPHHHADLIVLVCGGAYGDLHAETSAPDGGCCSQESSR